jgi:hypothetical protein
LNKGRLFAGLCFSRTANEANTKRVSHP